ncbi:heme ABC transporter ATP-binding protein [Microbacterium pseudoresistens]|uniref:Iron complex transport system ATP-binding protein n=1 Tax=Microbacterium pseudoresistens TaxID=640634 RepID=A0A7Y9ETS2_9MICO|nr:heme ABC transporter ATP-binding protein [Microbacterium pseudoresistens]NYD53803.1 iron complex transport system ATP-binding protein [Microbacterium pseudoresistens]
MTAAYEVLGVTHRVGGAMILDDVSLEVGYGRVLALVGPNGAGKSTMLGALAGDVRPARGEVLLDGAPLRSHHPRALARRRSLLLQANRVAFPFSVAQVVEMGCAPWQGAGRDDDTIIADAMRRADIAHLAHRIFGSLSGGEQARVSFARVLVQDAPVVLLDEPTAALDLRHQEELLRIARTLADEGRAVVAVLHDLSLAAAYADELAMLAEGRIVAVGTPAEVLTEERIESVYATEVGVVADPLNGHPLVLPRRA